MSTSEKPEIKAEVLELAEKLRKDITVAKNGEGAVPEGFYEKLLPEGVSMDQLKSIQAHNTNLIAAAGLVFGEKSIEVLKSHKDLEQTSLTIPTVGKDNLGFNFTRTRQVPGDGGTVTKYGSLSVKAETYGTGSRGQLLKVKQQLSEAATSAFGG